MQDPLGGMEVTGQGFGALAGIVREIAEATCNKVLLTLEGGYNPQGLHEGVKAVLRSLASAGPAGFREARRQRMPLSEKFCPYTGSTGKTSNKVDGLQKPMALRENKGTGL